MVGIVDDRPLAGRQDDHVAAVGGGKQLRVEDHVRRAGGHDPAVDEGRLVEAVGGAGQVVGGCDHRPSGPRLGLQDVHQVLLGRRVDAGDRLVQQVEVRVSRDCPGQEDPTPLTARQRADLALHRIRHADRLERIADGGAVRGAGARPTPISGTRPIMTTSPTVTGKPQSTTSAWGT